MFPFLTPVGLLFTFLGAALLFFYGLPRKKIGNVHIEGGSAYKVPARPGEPDVPDSEWEPVANRFLKRAKVLNSAGFALIALGTAMQMLAIYLSYD